MRPLLAEKLRTYARLGLRNVASVVLYRLGLASGLHPVTRLKAQRVQGPIFGAAACSPPIGAVPRISWREHGLCFGHKEIACGEGPPDWHANVLTGSRALSGVPWYQISDFDSVVGDIKGIWEISRFDWLIAMAQRAAFGDDRELDRINEWLADWTNENAPYDGVAWKCAQESSMRVLHLAATALILEQVDKPLPGMVDLLKLHIARIRPTTAYAVAQENNHGTSEAAALFVGGSWLQNLGFAEGEGAARTGLRLLGDRAAKLIMPDGSFSQYSLTYHRLMLDTFSFSETWRRKMNLPGFPRRVYGRLKAATLWLQQMVDPLTGDGPNLGANDGAQLFKLEDADYRDLRPTLQWASALFCGAKAISEVGDWDQRLRWFGIEEPKKALKAPTSTVMADGGYHVLRRGAAMAMLRFPRFRFRPSHADALHVDLWVKGQNVLRDGGSYSYNSSEDDLSYFSGTASHNTVMFDGRDQMPRLGRFLFGAWPEAFGVCMQEDLSGVWSHAGYKDYRGAVHERSLHLTDKRLEVRDRIHGNAQNAVMRWRLAPGEWALEDDCLRGQSITIRVEGEGSSKPALSLAEGEESRYYASRSAIPVLEAKVAVPAELVTIVEF